MSYFALWSVKKEGVRYARIPKKVFSHTHEENRLKLFNSIDLSMYAGTSWPLTIQTIGEKKNKNYFVPPRACYGKRCGI